MSDNLYYYNAGRAVPKEAQKSFNNGRFSGTDINPMWRIKKLTELFGPAGVGWYTDVLSERCEEHGESDTIAIVDLYLFVKVDGEWSKPIYGTGGNVIKRVNKYQKVDVSDEGYKMAYTDALSVACKALGIGADIYFASDRTKYSAAQESRERETRGKKDSSAAPQNDNGEVPFVYDDSDAPPEPERKGPVRTVFMADAVPPAPPTEAAAIACADCGKIITGRGKFSAEDMAKRTVNAFGYPLCYECGIARQKKINAENAGGTE